MPIERSLFLLDPSVNFLNHGSFGATPAPVFESYQHWQRELEHQPVEFLGRRAATLMVESRAALGAYLGTAPSNLVYVTNATVGLNIVARSLKLNAGDEVLATDHEYGALDRTWRFLSKQTGFKYINACVPLPVTDAYNFVEALWQQVTPRTRVIFISHITSPTALIFPVTEVCRRARAAGILTIIDGAHAPGQIDLNLDALGADFYSGNLHKWLCAPKGAAFLFARPEVQPLLQPLVVSWGYESDLPSDSPFIDLFEWQGTRDLAPFLAVPDAIAFQQAYDWPALRAECHALAAETRERIQTLSGLPALSPSSPEWFAQMVAARLPDDTDVVALKAHLYDAYRIEVPVHAWGRLKLVRISIQAYNSRADTDALVDALSKELRRSE